MDNGGRGTEAEMFEYFNNLKVKNKQLENLIHDMLFDIPVTEISYLSPAPPDTSSI